MSPDLDVAINDLDAVNLDRHQCLNVFSFAEQLNAASEHLVSYLDHQDKKVLTTTYKELHELIDCINNSDYFDKSSRTEAAEVQPTTENVAEVEQYEERKCCTDSSSLITHLV